MPGSDEYSVGPSPGRARISVDPFPERPVGARPSRRDRRVPTTEPFGPVPDLFLLSAFALLVAKSVLARGMALGWSVALSGLWLDAGVALLVVGSAALVFRRRSHLLMLAVYTAYCVLLFADSIYASFYQQLLDPQMLRIAGQTAEISDIIVSLLRPVYLVFFFDIPILLLWAVLLRRRHSLYRRAAIAVATGVSLALVISQLAFVSAVPPGTDSTTIASAWGMTTMQLASLGSMVSPREKSVFAAVSTTGTTAAVAAQVNTNAVSQFNDRLGEYAPTDGQRIAPFPVGSQKGKTVIIVQFESLERMFLDAKLEGQSVTPHVNQFVSESWDFPNTYAQTGIGNTADAEFTIATSMLPPLQQNATTAYADRVLPGLPRLCDTLGYETITLHTNDAQFWFRNDLYSALGYQKYYDKAFFKDRDKMWRGSSDEVLFQDGARALKSHVQTGKPVFATFVTMTSHLEYNEPRNYARRPLKLSPALASSYAGKYASSISYADAAFGQFIDELKAQGIYDDAVIVLIGDHMGLKNEDPTPQDTQVVRALLGRDHTYVDHQRVEFAIRIPGQKPKTVTGVRGVQDIMPTVADLIGADLSQTPHFGRSAFVEGPRLIPMRAYFPGGSYVDNEVVFVTGATEAEDQAFNILTGRKVDPPSRADSKMSAVRRFNVLSDDWMMSQPVREGGVNRRKTAAASSDEAQ
jgi:lipoteichoic acid synthase